MRMSIPRLNHLIEFGTVETVPADTLEGSEEKWVPKVKVHFAYYQRTQTQQVQLLGTKFQDTFVIAIRSSVHIADQLNAKIVGDPNLYRIITISRDDTSTPYQRKFDLVTLQDVRKVGSD